MESNALPPAKRLRRRSEFQRVFEAGRRGYGRYLTVVTAASKASTSRLGIVASKKVGGAVQRNRAKRLVRELFRNQPPPPAATDIVVIPKAALLSASGASLRQDYGLALTRSLSMSRK